MTRRGFSIAELLLALAVLAVAGGIVAQIATWTVQQRARYDDSQRAVRILENVLETARPQDAEWAATVKPTAELLSKWPLCTLTATVANDGPLKRVTVTISLDGTRTQSLSGWFP